MPRPRKLAAKSFVLDCSIALAWFFGDESHPYADAVANEVGKREELGSTGIGGGVAIPHARLREIKKPFGLLARLKNPIDFAAIDGGPVDIVFLMLLPAASQLDQLNTLAAAARKLRDGDLLSKLRKATTATELYRTIAG